ncbi:hypothetical protein C4D60_Mb04t07800 [Musa balbisiana]|uniref:Uncharacterized protein n=1 Tax=Musa balbisiana TaxID=52838 RepID=A0A4S8KAC5_MUSBA|nr:hypothetical protein C4D60_Mb04t07800 [Musa balbisiana]
MPRLTHWPSARPATEIAGRSSPNNRAKGSVACARRPPTPDPSAADSTGALSAPPPAPSAPGFGIPEFFSLFPPVFGPLGLMMLLDFDWNHIDRDLNHKKDVSNKCDCACSCHLNEEPSSLHIPIKCVHNVGHRVEGSSFHTLISHCPALNISHFNMRKLNWELGDYVLAH